MWTRRELKERAKNVLRGNYWKAFLISLVILIAGGDGAGGGSGAGRGGNNYNNGFGNGYDRSLPFNMSIENIFAIIGIALLVVFIVLIFALALRIFLGYPLEVGGRRYFVQSAQYFNNKGCFTFAFDNMHYMGIVKTMFLKGLQNFLWFLLFIIPGIVKAYAYSMVPYILSDNPNIGAKKVIQLSNNMTYGHKFDMFVLDLSFIGWYLLGVMALFVGVFFVKPYDYATKAELYLVLRKNALDRNMCSFNDLMLYGPGQEA